MNFTGYSYRNLLDLKSNTFLFKDLSVSNASYPSKITISGEGDSFGFSFSGNRVLDNYGKFIWSFNSGEPIDLLIEMENDIYQYSVNSDLVGNGYRSDFKIEKIIIDTDGYGLSFIPEFSSEAINLEAVVEPSFEAGGSVLFTLLNPSAAKVKVYSSKIGLYQSSPQDLNFQSNQTGILSGNQFLTFSSADLTNNSNPYPDFTFSLTSKTNAGDYLFPLSTSRVSSLKGISFINYSYPSKLSVNHSFEGLSEANRFVFERQDLDLLFSVGINKRTLGNDILDVTGFLEFSGVGFSGNNTGRFISGISITNSGLYSGIPSVVFSSFSGVESITVNEKNLISYEAGDSFSLLFSGNGTGVSATAHTKKVIINLFSGDNPSNKFRTITGVSINNAGSGFNGSYGVFMSGSVVDYPYSYVDDIASSLGYSPVSLATSFKTTAGFASGRALLSSGNSGQLSGVIIFGAGSGYDNGIQLPSVSFKRNASDFFSSNASGSCLMNSSGETISLLNNWKVLAGRSFSNSESDYSIIEQTGVGKNYFGPIVFSSEDERLYLKVKSKNFTSYQDTSLGFSLFQTGGYAKNFLIKKHNRYTITPDFENLYGLSSLDDNVVEEEE